MFSKHCLLTISLFLHLILSCIQQVFALDGFSLTPAPPAVTRNATVEYMDPSAPPLLLDVKPKCSILVLQESFANTMDAAPASANYSPPPDCPAPWSHVVLEVSASASDIQKDRIAAVWLDGAEILRTSTPQPMSPGVFWRVRKDVTRYTSLLRGTSGGSIFSIMLENSNATLPGVYSVNVSLHFYSGALCRAEETKNGSLGCGRLSTHPTIKELYSEPADMIIPISNEDGGCSGGGHWLHVRNESDLQLSTISIPSNTYRAVLEIYASAHGEDKTWYANPFRSTGLESSGANGAFRQVALTIDGKYAGAVVLTPMIIYPGSVNPFFWAPVVAIGAFDQPSYDIYLTPFLGMLLDGREHEFGLAVQGAQPHWLVTANLHLWIDAWSDRVEAGMVEYQVPPMRMSRQADWRNSDGKSAVDVQSIIRFGGWVSSSKSNLTTCVRHRLKFKSHVSVHRHGTMRQIALEIRARTDIRVHRSRGGVVARATASTMSPLRIETVSSKGAEEEVFEQTRLSHELQETRSVVRGKESWICTMADAQEAEGSVLVKDGEAVWGNGETRSSYRFRDDRTCYLRTVNAVRGRVVNDAVSPACVAVVSSAES